MPEPLVSVDRRCCATFGDPECPGWQVIQDDGECQWWSCELCGFDSGYILSNDPETCAAGVPVTGQLQGIPVPAHPAIPVARSSVPVFLGTIGRRTS